MSFLIIITGSICAVYLARLCYFSWYIMQKKRKLVPVDSMKDMTLNTKYDWKILNPTMLKAVSPSYFILKTENGGLLESEKSKEKPIHWQYSNYYSVTSELLPGSLQLVAGNNVTLRLTSSEEPHEIEYIGYYQYLRNDAAMMTILMGAMTLCFWALLVIAPELK